MGKFWFPVLFLKYESFPSPYGKHFSKEVFTYCYFDNLGEYRFSDFIRGTLDLLEPDLLELFHSRLIFLSISYHVISKFREIKNITYCLKSQCSVSGISLLNWAVEMSDMAHLGSGGLWSQYVHVDTLGFIFHWTFKFSAKFSRLKREEAKITAWENLQKAEAEAAIKNLEVFIRPFILLASHRLVIFFSSVYGL